MKILFTVSTYYPKKDGVQNVTSYLAEGLVKLGHDVTVFTSYFDKNLPIEEKHNGVLIKRFNLYTKYGLYFGDKKNYVKCVTEYAEKVDVLVNVCTQNAFTDLLLKNLKSLKCKKILYKHGMFDFRFNKINFSSFRSIINKIWKEVRWYFYYNFNGKYFKCYNNIIELHKKSYGYTYFYNKYNIQSCVIENAADDDFFREKKTCEFIKPFEKYIINVSNYGDGKNQKLSIEQFLKSDIDKSIGLVLIGSKKNNYYESLCQYINKLRKKNNLTINEKPIKILYGIDRNLIPLYVSNAYLYLMTSKAEVFPVSLIESMACGVPFISTNVGIAKYLYGGITVSKNDDIHYYIEELCKNLKLRNNLGTVGRQYALDNMQISDKVRLLEKIIKS